MSVNIWFWLIYVLSIIFGGWINFPFERRSYTFVILMVLIGLLGWAQFGGPIH